MLFDCTANLTAALRTRRMQKLCHCSTQRAKFILSEAIYTATKKTASPWRLETRSRCGRRASSSGRARLRLGQHWTITGASICASPCATRTRAPPTQTTRLVLLWMRSEPMLPLSRPPSTCHPPLPQNFNLPKTCAQTAQCVQVINCFRCLNSQLFFCYFSMPIMYLVVVS